MSTTSADLVIECVRYLPSGQIDFVRLYERRGIAFSDRVIYTRDQLLQMLQKKKRVFTGNRIAARAGAYELSRQVILAGTQPAIFITTSSDPVDRDLLEDVPTL